MLLAIVLTPSENPNRQSCLQIDLHRVSDGKSQPVNSRATKIHSSSASRGKFEDIDAEMLRFMLCISCCSAPPPRSANRRVSSSTQLKGGDSNKTSNQNLNEGALASNGEEAKLNGPVGSSEKGELLVNQIHPNNENYGTENSGDSQGKLTPPSSEQSGNSVVVAASDVKQLEASSTIRVKLQRDDAFDLGNMNSGEIERLQDLESGYRAARNGGGASDSSPSYIDIGPFTESASTTTSRMIEMVSAAVVDQSQQMTTADWSSKTGQRQLEQQRQQQLENEEFEDETDRAAHIYDEARDGLEPAQSSQASRRYEPLASASLDVPSTTKIGDYARIEYSPVEDLESVTTMSYSRFGSEKGGSRSQAGSSVSRRNSTKATTNEGSISRRSSQGGVESTSISIASQLSNEQFQQNLTNMLESVNSNYSTIGMIGLPLGPPIEGVETTKTSPETPGAALTSASQDSLSDIAFDELSPASSRPETSRSNASIGAALVGDSLERQNAMDDISDLAQSAPLASGEDDEQPQRTPNEMNSDEFKTSVERVGSPQSIATTTSGALTNPTPTPSEMSTGSGKKKRIKAKALFKKLRPGSKKKNKDEPN